MSALDKNKIFISMVKYILSEQKNVDWVFKTSLMSYSGSKQKIGKTSSSSLLNNIIDFIYQIKPYHTQFTNYEVSYQTDIEEINIHMDESQKWNETIRFDNASPTPDEELLKEIEEKGSGVSDKWIETTMANRVVYSLAKKGKEIPSHKELQLLLNSDFKGTFLNGGDFSSDVFGYDMIDYDEDQYDSPTIIYDYYLRDFNVSDDKLLERFILNSETKKWEKSDVPFVKTDDFKYEKSFSQVGETLFSFDDERVEGRNNIQCLLYRKNVNKTSIITDFDLNFSGVWQLEIFDTLKKGDILYIKFKKDDETLFRELVFEADSFIEQDADNIRRKIISFNDPIVVEEPESDITSKKLLAVRQLPNGNRIPFTNYKRYKGQVTAYGLNPNEHLILSAFDYQYYYDVVIKSTDIGGRSNNTIIYTGGNLLRPHYEADRPSEFACSFPTDSVVIVESNGFYHHIDFKGKDVYNRSVFKDGLKIKEIRKSQQGIVEMFSLENDDKVPDKLPIRFLINGEIISASKKEDGFYKNLMRALDGTHHNCNDETDVDIDISDEVSLLNDVFENEQQNITISYMVKDATENTYIAPFGSDSDKDTFEVYLQKYNEQIPTQIDSSQIVIKKDGKFKIGDVEYRDGGAIAIYDSLEELLYLIVDNKVYDKYNDVVGRKKGNILIDTKEKKIGMIKDDLFLGIVVTVTIYSELNTGDVIHISCIKSEN